MMKIEVTLAEFTVLKDLVDMAKTLTGRHLLNTIVRLMGGMARGKLILTGMNTMAN